MIVMHEKYTTDGWTGGLISHSHVIRDTATYNTICMCVYTHIQTVLYFERLLRRTRIRLKISALRICVCQI